MKVQALNTQRYLNDKKNNTINFGMHPTYSKLIGQGEIRGSNLFRRSTGIYGFQSRDFENVETAIKSTIARIVKPKILIVGVGSGEEPLSFLAVVKSCIKNEALSEKLDLHCVDLQPQIGNWTLDGFSEGMQFPLFARDSFEKYSDAKGELYRIKPEILNYLKETFENPKKSKWDTSIEEFSAQCPSATYDIISMNNVLGYIKEPQARIQTLLDLKRMLKTNGTIITDPEAGKYFPCLAQMNEQAPGIFQNS